MVTAYCFIPLTPFQCAGEREPPVPLYPFKLRIKETGGFASGFEEEKTCYLYKKYVSIFARFLVRRGQRCYNKSGTSRHTDPEYRAAGFAGSCEIGGTDRPMSGASARSGGVLLPQPLDETGKDVFQQDDRPPDEEIRNVVCSRATGADHQSAFPHAGKGRRAVRCDGEQPMV